MKTFIFYTKDGFTQDINNNNVENMQILGFAQGSDENVAYEKLRSIFNKKNEYCFKEIIAQEVIGNPIYL